MRTSKITVQGIQIDGRSVSGFETAIALPHYNICFDIGGVSHAAKMAENVAITHGHFDHMGMVGKHAYLRRMLSMSTSHYIVPPHLAPFVDETFDFWARAQSGRKPPYRTTSVAPGGKVEIGKDRFVTPFDTDHRIDSQGYVLVVARRKLKAKYHGLPGREIARLRTQEGEEVMEAFEIPLFAFTGDTRASIFTPARRKGLLALKAKVLMVECTFFGDVTVAEANKKGHVHIDQLAENARAFKDTGTVVLCHFSKRYKNADVEAAIKTLPKSLREKTTFLPLDK